VKFLRPTHLVPLFEKAFRRHKRPVGKSWRMDETYIRVKGEWRYLYRAVDKDGNTIDFLLRAKRDKVAARRFFEKSIAHNGVPEIVTIDKSGANLAALEAINADRETPIGIRQSKYLNNLVEQDHRAIKRRCVPMFALKSFRTAAVTLAGLELAHRIRKRQFSFGRGGPRQFSSLKHLWAHALAHHDVPARRTEAARMTVSRQCTRTQVLAC